MLLRRYGKMSHMMLRVTYGVLGASYMKWLLWNHRSRLRICRAFTSGFSKGSFQKYLTIFQVIYGRCSKLWSKSFQRKDQQLMSLCCIPYLWRGNPNISPSSRRKNSSTKILQVKATCLRPSECQTTSCIFQAGFRRKTMTHLLMEDSFQTTDDPELVVLTSNSNNIRTLWARRGL